MAMVQDDKVVLVQLEDQFRLLMESCGQDASTTCSDDFFKGLLSSDKSNDVSRQSIGGSSQGLPRKHGMCSTNASSTATLLSCPSTPASSARTVQSRDVGMQRSLKSRIFSRTAASDSDSSVDVQTAESTPAQGGCITRLAPVHTRPYIVGLRPTGMLLSSEEASTEEVRPKMYQPDAVWNDGRARSPVDRRVAREALILREFAPEVMPELQLRRGVPEQRWEKSVCKEKKTEDASITRPRFRSHDLDCLALGQLQTIRERSPAIARSRQHEIHSHFSSSVCDKKQAEDATKSGAFRRSPSRDTMPTGIQAFLGDCRTVKGEAEQLWEASICEPKKAGDASLTTEPFRSHDSDCLAMGQLRTLREQSRCLARVQQVEIHTHFSSSVCTEKQLEDGRGRNTVRCARIGLGGSSRSPLRSQLLQVVRR